MTFTEIVLASFLGQALLVSACALAYVLVALIRFLNEWREDMAELRRARRRARLEKRLAECGG